MGTHVERVGSGDAARRLVLAMPLVSLLVSHALFPPFYQMNDDGVMTLLASGTLIAPQPSPYLLWIHPGLGAVLVQLYSSVTGVPWYRILLILLQLLAGFTCAWAFCQGNRGRDRALLAVVYFLVVDGMTYALPQYTITAALLGQSGILVWLACARGRPWDVPAGSLFVTVMTMGALLRAEACALTLLLALPLLLVHTLLPEAPVTSRGRRLARLWLPFGLAGVLLLLCVSSHELVYSSHPQGKHTHSLRRAVSLFTDYGLAPHDSATRDIYQQAGWSSNDRELLDDFFFADPEVYHLDRILQIQRGVDRSAPSTGSLAVATSIALEDPLGRLLFFLALLPVLFLGDSPAARRGHVATLLGGIAAWFFLATYLDRPAFRVLLPILSFVTGVGVMSAGSSSAPSRSVRRARVGMTLAFAIWSVVPARVLAAFLEEQHRRASELKARIRRLDTARIYVVSNRLLHEARFTPTEDLRAWRGFRFVAVGATAGNPTHFEQLRAVGIEDLMTALHARPDVRLLCERGLARRLGTFLEEHRGIRARLEEEPLDPASEDPAAPAVFRFVEAVPLGPRYK